MTRKFKAPEGVVHPKAVEDDVEGHGSKFKAPEGVVHPKAIEDDVEGHGSKFKAPDGVVHPKAIEDDVEGHTIGSMHPIMARDLARAKERDVQRAVSRGNLISEAKRARRKD